MSRSILPILLSVIVITSGCSRDSLSRTRRSVDDDEVAYESRWMEEIYQHQPETHISEVLIPGTHNSATSGITTRSPYAIEHTLRVSKRLTALWSKCQDRSVGQQLEDGIRYLDIRVEKGPTGGSNRGDSERVVISKRQASTGWYTYHGLVSDRLEDIIDQIAEFATNRPKEVVIVDFQHIRGFDEAEHEKLVRYLLNHNGLAPRLADYNNGGPTTTFKSLWDHDQNVILMYPEYIEAITTNKVWPAWIQNPWLDMENSRLLLRGLVSNIKDRPRSVFYVSQAIVTPSYSTIVSSLFSSGPNSLREMAVSRVSNKMATFVQRLYNKAVQHEQRANIVIVDFYETTRLVSKMLEINREELGLTAPDENNNDGGNVQGDQNVNEQSSSGTRSAIELMGAIFDIFG